MYGTVNSPPPNNRLYNFHYFKLVWFPDPSCVGGARERERREGSLTPPTRKGLGTKLISSHKNYVNYTDNYEARYLK